ncbi:hypothetical protein Afil01_60420 [Actinorhabdospora filicis]|uniref:Chaplin domain-containing protein n=1 Tax=Actinorhabdospora filicis TaxID=1785913 RepID=A0A9W6SQR9_9ACTN|nr:chaplin family protein [Actinorhabdospora filicis]GLZ81235.1 hypothetical protein Afil01_60420 [Actinorhabdospora filicis]
MNSSLARTGVKVGMLAAGLVLLAGGTAQAGGNATTGGNYGLGNGNQLLTGIQVPISVCGNSLAVLGASNAGCHGNSTATTKDSHAGKGHGHGHNMTTGHNYGVLNGNQASTDVQVPVTVCGNAIAIFGVANAGCQGDATATSGATHK